MPCDQILIFDSCSLINAKTVIRVDEQWWFFDGLLARMKRGEIVVPREVVKEISGGPYPDMPGGWAASTYNLTPHPTEATYESIHQVMDKVGDVVESDAEFEKADPWVLALALDLIDLGLEPVVVTDDFRDRQVKIALATACHIMGVPWIRLDEAFEWLENHPVELAG